jgi:hypothetical protein
MLARFDYLSESCSYVGLVRLGVAKREMLAHGIGAGLFTTVHRLRRQAILIYRERWWGQIQGIV